MNILQKVLSKKSTIKSVVRIGSNYLNVSVNEDLSCKQYVINCLKKCKIIVPNSPNGYNLFLKHDMNEKQISYETDLYQLLNHLTENETNFELCIRKSQITKVSNIKQVRKLKQIKSKKTNATIRSLTHYYEDIDANLHAPNQMNVTRTISNPKLNKIWRKSVVYNLKSIHRIREKLKSKIINLDQEIFI